MGRKTCRLCGQQLTRSKMVDGQKLTISHETVDDGNISKCVNHYSGAKKVYTAGQVIDVLFPKGQYNSQTRKLYFDRPQETVKKDLQAFARFNGLEMEA